MRPNPPAELTFEPPPRLSWRPERRLAGRAVAVWQAYCGSGTLPSAADFEADELAIFCAGNSVGLVAGTGGVDVASVGANVTAAFGLGRGPLTSAVSPLSAKLLRKFAKLCGLRKPVSFEHSLNGRGSEGLLLTRGVLLPLLDDAGALTQALAILTWKEVLAATATDRLLGEIGGAIAAGRAAQQSSGSPRVPLESAAFAVQPGASQGRTVATSPAQTPWSIGARQTCYRVAADA